LSWQALAAAAVRLVCSLYFRCARSDDCVQEMWIVYLMGSMFDLGARFQVIGFVVDCPYCSFLFLFYNEYECNDKQ
jgi:hypothetical protein